MRSSECLAVEKPRGNVLLLEFLRLILEVESSLIGRLSECRSVLMRELPGELPLVKGDTLSAVSYSLSCNICRVVLVRGILGVAGLRLMVPCCENSDSKPCSVEGVEALER